MKEIPFEVNCFNVVSTHQVTVKNMVTGKEYKQYVPEIGKQINPKAYK